MQMTLSKVTQGLGQDLDTGYQKLTILLSLGASSFSRETTKYSDYNYKHEFTY